MWYFRTLCLLLFTYGSTTAVLAQPALTDNGPLYSRQELQDDFHYFINRLQKKHPGLYTYITREHFEQLTDSLSSVIGDNMPDSHLLNQLTYLCAVIRDGHSMVLPGKASLQRYESRGCFFPFYICIDGDRMFVNMNCTADTVTIPPGAELISINGEPVDQVIRYLLAHTIRDGYNETYPNWILKNYFRSYFGFLKGHPTSFHIVYRNGQMNGEADIRALPADSITYYRNQNYAGRAGSAPEKQGLKLQYFPATATALLTIKDFHNSVLRSVYKQSFASVIPGFFGEMQQQAVRNLIIDLRDNQGGDIENGELLLSYLVNQPFHIIDEGPSSGLITAATPVFTGKLYVLINGGSFSNSGIVSSFLQKTKRAVFIGEETGGNRTEIYGNAYECYLPNTRLYCQISTRRYLLNKDNKNEGRGVIPDYPVIPSIQDIIAGRDPALQKAMELIQAAAGLSK